MQVDLKIRRHPGKQALLAYAENLVDNRRGVDRAIAAHLSQCPACRAEVQAVQGTFAFAASAPALAPSTESTAQILMAGKQARNEMKKSGAPLRAAWLVARGGACAAAMVLVTALTFSAFLRAPGDEAAAPTIQRSTPSAIGSSAVTPEAARQAATEAAAEVRALSAAIQHKQGEAQTPRERETMRVVQARDDDTAVALQALERNPRNAQANRVVNANLKTLRSIYGDGGSL